jgi:hypothetical protein
MSDSGLLQSFNINELAGATGLILGGVSGLLVVIFKSRCYCKFRVGCNDQCSLCMCERKPPPDPTNNDDTDDDDIKKNDKNKVLKPTKSKPQEDVEPDVVDTTNERLIPNDNLV